MSEEQIDFSELNIAIGQSIEALPQSAGTKEFTEVLVIGGIPGEALIITATPDGIFPKMSEGETVIFKIALADGIALFTAQVLFISDVPAFMVYLDFPVKAKFRRIRNATRVKVTLPVLASNMDNKAMSGCAGRIKDISTTGAGLEMYEPLGEEGHRIVIKGKFNVGDIQRILSIDAVIRLKKQIDPKTIFYGIEFLESDENDLLVLFGFIFNAMSFGKIQKIR